MYIYIHTYRYSHTSGGLCEEAAGHFSFHVRADLNLLLNSKQTEDETGTSDVLPSAEIGLDSLTMRGGLL